MTGPDHYLQAERLLNLDAARAQVHATLALAAATIDTAGVELNDRAGWHGATS